MHIRLATKCCLAQPPSRACAKGNRTNITHAPRAFLLNLLGAEKTDMVRNCKVRPLFIDMRRGKFQHTVGLQKLISGARPVGRRPFR